ncbi:chorismate synthase [bacterium]|nr:chorismate synthase [candidate division CSSED10-310 bacterium]
MSIIQLQTAGESHGFSLLAVLEGIPSGLMVDPETINLQLARLHSKFNLSNEQSILNEEDEVSILSGIRSGETLGVPITLQIENRQTGLVRTMMLHSMDKRVMGAWSTPRPGYADLAGAIKYGYRDLRYVDERAGARETAIRVAAGTIARRFLLHFGIDLFSHIIAIGPAEIGNIPSDLDEIRRRAEISVVRCADPEAANNMNLALEGARRDGDTLGGIFELVITGVPVGLGSYNQWFTRIDAQLSMALMSLPGARGVEIGSGFRAASQISNSAHDPLFVHKTRSRADRDIVYRTSNNSGGIEGGVTNGSPIIMRVAIAPYPSPMKPMPSVNLQTMQPDHPPQTFGEICTVGPMSVVAEAMAALILADNMLMKFGGDSIDEVKENFAAYQERLPFIVEPNPPEVEEDINT